MGISHSEAYAAAGVDIEAGYQGVKMMNRYVQRTLTADVISDLGGFGGLFSLDLHGLEKPVLVSGTDGVGTKQRIAQLMDRHNTVGIDCVAMCVNDIICCGAKPLFFLDYIAIGKNIPEKVVSLVSGVSEGCVRAGCALIGGETAEHPGTMKPDDYDLAGFAVGVVDRGKILDKNKMQPGDVVIALPSSGLHSNGYSLARKVCVEGKTHYELRLEREELDGASLQDALLTPTRIYVKPVRAVLDACPGAVRALAHITGGGISENLDRALPKSCAAEVDLGTWPVPAIASFVCDAAHLDEAEALKTFNMGLGMVLIVDAARADEVEAALTQAGETTYRVGRIVAGEGEVRYANDGKLYGFGAEA